MKMPGGSEDRNKIIAVAAFLIIALGVLYWEVYGGTSTPAPAPVVEVTAPASIPNETAPQAVHGRAAKTLGTTSAGLDPSLHMGAMLVSEAVEYSGSGRNIFSGASEPPPIVIPKPVASARPVANLPPPPTTPQPYVPPPQPPIPLKFFGFEIPPNGTRQAFLLDGDTVVLANAGDIVRRRYHVLAIDAKSITVEDMLDNNKQKLPLSAN